MLSLRRRCRKNDFFQSLGGKQKEVPLNKSDDFLSLLPTTLLVRQLVVDLDTRAYYCIFGIGGRRGDEEGGKKRERGEEGKSGRHHHAWRLHTFPDKEKQHEVFARINYSRRGINDKGRSKWQLPPILGLEEEKN